METKYEIVLTDEAANSYDRLSRDRKTLLDKKFHQVASDPYYFKSLRGRLKDLRSIRMGPWRIIYKISEKNREVHVLDIATRDKAY